MKILELLETDTSKKASPDSRVPVPAYSLEGRPIKDQVIVQLQTMLVSMGIQLGRYLNRDEIALATGIVQLALQDDDFHPSEVTESLARFILSKYELARALV